MGLKPHEFRELVNDLTDIARTYAGTQCLRDVISRRLGIDVKIDTPNKDIPVPPEFPECQTLSESWSLNGLRHTSTNRG